MLPFIEKSQLKMPISKPVIFYVIKTFIKNLGIDWLNFQTHEFSQGLFLMKITVFEIFSFDMFNIFYKLKFLSFANISISSSEELERLLTYNNNKKSNGPSVESCGTPQRMLLRLCFKIMT